MGIDMGISKLPILSCYSLFSKPIILLTVGIVIAWSQPVSGLCKQKCGKVVTVECLVCFFFSLFCPHVISYHDFSVCPHLVSFSLLFVNCHPFCCSFPELHFPQFIVTCSPLFFTLVSCLVGSFTCVFIVLSFLSSIANYCLCIGKL